MKSPCITNQLMKSLKDLKDRTLGISFAAQQALSLHDFSIRLDNSKRFGPPFTPQKLKQLFELGQPASFGKGSATLLDPNVRNTMEIKGGRLQVEGPQWIHSVNQMLNQLLVNLGITDVNSVELTLHNLLVYGKGQFFKPHQDSEKTDNMIASLVIVLPTRHTGGELIVYNGETVKKFEHRFHGEQAHAVAFYADCHHEVCPVGSGYRLVLTYNIMANQSAVRAQKKDTALLSSSLHEYFVALESQNSRSKLQSDAPYLVFLLDHQYTQKSLSWNALKGLDRHVLSEFMAAESTLDLHLSLALVDVKQTWNAECEYDDEYDEFENDSLDSTPRSQRKATVPDSSDLIDEDYDIVYWLNRNNSVSHNADFNISANHVISMHATEKLKPFDTEFEGWMGNYGNTVDRWYHRTALIVWQKKHNRYFHLGTDLQQSLKDLCQELKENRNAAHNEFVELLPRLKQLALQSAEHAEFVELALLILDKNLARELLQSIASGLMKKDKIPLLKRLAETYGDSWVDNLFIDKDKSYEFSTWPIKEALVSGLGSLPLLYAVRPKLARKLFIKAIEILQENWQHRHEMGPAFIKEIQKQSDKELVELFSVLDSLSDLDLEFGHAIVTAIAEKPMVFNSIDTANLLLKIRRKNSKVGGESSTCRGLLQVFQHRLEAEASRHRSQHDWSIDETPSCSCDDCTVLTSFLKDAVTKQIVLPLKKERRYHLHRAIDSLAIPVTHKTSRVGSPHKLVLTKASNLFAQAEKRRKSAEQALRNLTN
ncbi:MAG: 2OG-Fe(II) oxygenase [Pseudobdellovibrionaceae bacterium]|nr:2OG-Fe(II) oxygenase [Pseudobdellovibrionaceae bacterium]